MGCNCGGGIPGIWFLVTLPDGVRRIVRTDTGARLLVTMNDGGTWRRVDQDEVDRLAEEGILPD